MKLVRYCVMNFRSVKNSGWIDCDDVTTLVGVNESGKSNLLLALWKLNPARGGEIDILHDMPVSELSTLRNRKNEVKFISAEFEMEKDCAEVISKNTGYKCEEGMRVIVSRFYDGRYEIDFPDGDPEVMICAEKEIISNSGSVKDPLFLCLLLPPFLLYIKAGTSFHVLCFYLLILLSV